MANPIGRPSDYKPEYCEMVIPMLKEGMCIAEIGLQLDVGYTTIYRWMDEHEDFREAIKKGREFSEAWWKAKGRANLENDKFSSTLWYMNMRNRFGWGNKEDTSANSSVQQVSEDVIKEKEKDY